MLRLKARDRVHLVIVGQAGWPPGLGKTPVDTRRAVDACEVEDCKEPATQVHGPTHALIKTCDDHSQEVMMEIVRVAFGPLF